MRVLLSRRRSLSRKGKNRGQESGSRPQDRPAPDSGDWGSGGAKGGEGRHGRDVWFAHGTIPQKQRSGWQEQKE
jgi:hypothetical protein